MLYEEQKLLRASKNGSSTAQSIGKSKNDASFFHSWYQDSLNAFMAQSAGDPKTLNSVYHKHMY